MAAERNDVADGFVLAIFVRLKHSHDSVHFSGTGARMVKLWVSRIPIYSSLPESEQVTEDEINDAITEAVFRYFSISF